MEFSFSQVLLALLYHFKVWRPVASVNHNKADESHRIYPLQDSMPLLHLSCSGGCSRKCHPWKVWTMSDTSDMRLKSLKSLKSWESDPVRATSEPTCQDHQDRQLHLWNLWTPRLKSTSTVDMPAAPLENSQLPFHDLEGIQGSGSA